MSRHSAATLDAFLKKIMEISLRSPNGHLDLMVRFLHGLSVESNQKLLDRLLGRVAYSPEAIQKVSNNLKEMNCDIPILQVFPDRSINVFHCLMEMNDLSVFQEITEFLKSQNRSQKKLSDIQCSALAHMLQMSEEVLEEFDPTEYSPADHDQMILIPVVRNCRRFRISTYELSNPQCEVIASAMKSSPSHLRELDLKRNRISSAGILCSGLQSPNCQLEVLRLNSLSDIDCGLMASALRSGPPRLKELDLADCDLSGPGAQFVCVPLQSPDHQLEALSLDFCELSDQGYESVASALMSSPSYLKRLELNGQRPGDLGVALLSAGLGSPTCELHTLRMDKCDLSEGSCVLIGSALEANPSHLRWLSLKDCRFGGSAVKPLAGFLKSPRCKLQTLSLYHCGLSGTSFSFLVSALVSNPSHLLEKLDLSWNKLRDSGVKELCGFLQSPQCALLILRLEKCRLTAVSCSLLALALRSGPARLKELDLSNNKLQDRGVMELCGFLGGPSCRLQTLSLDRCCLSKTSCDALASTQRSNVATLRELSLDFNNLKKQDVERLVHLQNSPSSKLKNLNWEL
ncbi:unnamed protein product [Menidia menidia]|uniref:(Atlantic silverside) hypothetical protein n=1 Tax=Menidia menidia TaxID=238744 RepID=A0A8S4B1V4_9TELE|nr:unnamed protein product [Menidia menidia]